MITTIAKPADPKPLKPKYPYLGKLKTGVSDGEYVVLFTAPDTGVVVHDFNRNETRQSMAGCRWSSFIEDKFEYFNGTIELKNE